MSLESANRCGVVGVLEKYGTRYDLYTRASLFVKDRDGVFASEYNYPHSYSPEPGKEKIFDIASLTKLLYSTALLFALSEKGVSLETSARNFTPQFEEGVTIEDVLSYRVWIENKKWFAVMSSMLFHEHSAGSPKCIGELIKSVRFRKVESSVYSKYANMTAQGILWLLEAVSGLPAKDALKKYVLEPAQMQDTIIAPDWNGATLKRVVKAEIVGKEVQVGTEESELYRRIKFKVGLPSDEWAHQFIKRFGITPGFSGIFSTASDLAKFAELILQALQTRERKKITYPIKSKLGLGRPLFSDEVAGKIRNSRFSHIDASKINQNIFCCGFRFKGKDDRVFGRVPSHVFGHAGFTGSFLAVNPLHGRYVIALTNPNYPSRERKKHLSVGINDFRRELSEFIFTSNNI